MSYRAIVNRKEIEVRFSSDGAIWTWEEGRGQVVLATSDHAFSFVMNNVVRADRVDALRFCKTWPEKKYPPREQRRGRPRGLKVASIVGSGIED